MSEQFEDVVHLTNIVYQIVHCRFLCRGPGVERFTVSINATDIADPDAMIIVTDTMCPCDREWPTGFYSSVQIDYIVIANLAETACTVHTINILSFDILSGMGGRAMDDLSLIHISEPTRRS